MSESNAPRGRRRNVTGTASVGDRKGEGLGAGPVGDGSRQEAEEQQEQREQEAQQQEQQEQPKKPAHQASPSQKPDQPKQDSEDRGLVGDVLGGVLGGGSSGSSSSAGVGNILGGILGGSQSSAKPSSSAGSLLGSVLGGGQSSTSGKPASNAGTNGGSAGSSGGQSGKSGGFNKLLLIILAVVAIFLIYKFVLSPSNDSNNSGSQVDLQTDSSSSSSSGGILSSLFSGLTGSSSYSVASDYTGSAGASSLSYSASGNGEVTTLNTRSADGARAKYFTPQRTKSREKVTVMIYMCGTDLESQSSMATRDLQEMAKAEYGENVRVLVYTGGCASWHVQNISSSVNQIWRVYSGGRMELLESNAGTGAMTNPATLSSFIQYCENEYIDTTRRILILWDHGGGSLSGYGYDEKNKTAGSMTLPNIQKALQDGLGEKKLDFLGFDACLMATVETALMAEEFADYLIASEETEPGVGWYYTDWLTELGRKPNIATTDLGKVIIDSFITACSSQARGQKTTLSLVDLADLKAALPTTLVSFSNHVTEEVQGGNYQTVATARSGAREFAASSQIDQVDLTDLANRIGGDEAEALTDAISIAVKYNRTGGLTGAYGLSIYFPYRRTANVSKAVTINNAIEDMDDSYSTCIRAFAAMGGGGAYVGSGGSASYNTVTSGGQYSSSSSSVGISDLLGLFLRSNADLSDAIDSEAATTYISGHSIDPSALTFTTQDGAPVMRLSDSQWSLVTGIALNVFYRDSEGGFIDLGLDNVYDWDSSGGLIGDTTGAWITLNGQIVAYYVERVCADTDEAYGYIPVLINDERYELLTYYDGEAFAVTGARRVYTDGATDTIAKASAEFNLFDAIGGELGEDNAMEIPVGEIETITGRIEVQPLCDYYDENYTYQDSYQFGDVIVSENGLAGLTVAESYIDQPSRIVCSYRLTDIYQQYWWTSPYTLK